MQSSNEKAIHDEYVEHIKSLAAKNFDIEDVFFPNNCLNSLETYHTNRESKPNKNKLFRGH